LKHANKHTRLSDYTILYNNTTQRSKNYSNQTKGTKLFVKEQLLDRYNVQTMNGLCDRKVEKTWYIRYLYHYVIFFN